MKRALVGCVLAAGLLAASPANAEVKAKAPDGFTLQIKAQVPLDGNDAWARLLDIASWWNGAHTYSGDAKALSIDAQAGGCWCEIWNGGEVEHGRVLMVMPRDMIRFDAPLGPLQELGVNTSLTFTLTDQGVDKTLVTVDFKVSGSSLSGLEELAPLVDMVLTEAVTRFASPT